ncbi:hypothetical protein L1987_48526 [Smallanthus sonchifolius]|uniref:Uncharacterized protein n=1 Tax=Smallanthus sonchifolius TaxID=185202 RepID=A0ACB9FT39_9ASTR|nr:hypothetical protein L1987_48526 [Smallanthus sonchifolius]
MTHHPHPLNQTLFFLLKHFPMDSFAVLPAVTEHHAQPFSISGAHLPYSEMIIAAIAALNDKDGSSRQAIAKYIEREYPNLPPTHPNLLTHHLKRMKNERELMMIKHSYTLPPPRSVPFETPTPIMDNHFTDYSITATHSFANTAPETSSVTPRRKPGRPPKPRHDSGYQQQPPPQFEGQDGSGQELEPPIFASLGLAKRGRGRPPKGASASASGPKLMSISAVVKRGKPKEPLSGNVTRPRGRPKRSADAESASVSRSRDRPPKKNFRNSSKVGLGTVVLVTDPQQLVAYQQLKLKYENLQSKAKEVVGVVRPYINPDYEAFGSLQELETLVATYASVQSEKQPSYV